MLVAVEELSILLKKGFVVCMLALGRLALSCDDPHGDHHPSAYEGDDADVDDVDHVVIAIWYL